MRAYTRKINSTLFSHDTKEFRIFWKLHMNIYLKKHFTKIFSFRHKFTNLQEGAGIFFFTNKNCKNVAHLTWQVQTAHRLKPNGGMYGCQRLPSGWNRLCSPRVQPRPESAAVDGEQVAQHSPAGMIGSEQIVVGQTISSHTTDPRWQLNKQVINNQNSYLIYYLFRLARRNLQKTGLQTINPTIRKNWTLKS